MEDTGTSESAEEDISFSVMDTTTTDDDSASSSSKRLSLEQPGIPLKKPRIVLEKYNGLSPSRSLTPTKRPTSVEIPEKSPCKMKGISVNCRLPQFTLLSRIFGENSNHPLPGTLFLWGASASGKCYTLEKVLEGKENIHVIKMHCAEILCGRRAFYETFVKQLVSYANRKLSSNFKCDNLRSLYGNVYDFMNGANARSPIRVVAIIQGIETLKGEDDDILRFLANLKGMVKAKICVALLSTLPPSHYMPDIMEHVFIPIHFPQYTSEELTQILKEEKIPRRKSDIGGSYYDFYAKMIVSMFYPVCRDIRKLIRLASSHWESFQDMVEQSKDVNLTKLWKTVEPQMKAQFYDLNSSLVPSNQPNDIRINHENNGKCLNLPLNAKFLLIASYLATHNPPSSDKRFFVKGKQGKKSRKNLSSKTDPKSFVRSFELNRLTAIFNWIQEYCSDEVVNKSRSISLMTLLTTLCQNKLIQHLGEDSVGNIKYKCLIDYDAVLDISRSVHFDLNEYLYRLL